MNDKEYVKKQIEYEQQICGNCKNNEKGKDRPVCSLGRYIECQIDGSGKYFSSKKK